MSTTAPTPESTVATEEDLLVTVADAEKLLRDCMVVYTRVVRVTTDWAILYTRGPHGSEVAMTAWLEDDNGKPCLCTQPGWPVDQASSATLRPKQLDIHDPYGSDADEA